MPAKKTTKQKPPVKEVIRLAPPMIQAPDISLEDIFKDEIPHPIDYQDDFVPFEHPAEDPATPLPMVEQLKNEVDSPTDGIDVTNMTYLLSLLHADLKGLIRNPNISSHLSDRNKQIIKIRMNQIKHCLDVNVQ